MVIKIKPQLSIILFYAIHLGVIFAAPFELTTSHPSHPDFKKQYLGLYGINSAIEPELTKRDRPLYEKVYPYLQEQPTLAIQTLLENVNQESNTAFDYLLGMLYYQADDLENSLKWLNAGLKKFPDFRRAIRTRAIVYIRMDDYTNATPNLLRTIALGGGDAQTYGLLAYSYLKLEKYGSALSAYQMAKMFKPDSRDFKMGEAYCYYRMNKNQEAIALFDELLRETPQNKDLWLSQTNAYLAENDFDQAIANLEILRSMGLADFNIKTLLSQLYFNKEIPEQSLALAIEAAQDNELEASHGSELLALLQLFLQRQWFEPAQKLLQAIPNTLRASLAEKEKQAWDLAQASLDLNQGNLNEAEVTLKRVLKGDPLNGSALLLMGDYQKARTQLEEAIFYYERATHLSEHQAKAFLALGQVYVSQSEFSKALEVLYKAYRLSPEKYIQDYIQQVEKAYKSTF